MRRRRGRAKGPLKGDYRLVESCVCSGNGGRDRPIRSWPGNTASSSDTGTIHPASGTERLAWGPSCCRGWTTRPCEWGRPETVKWRLHATAPNRCLESRKSIPQSLDSGSLIDATALRAGQDAVGIRSSVSVASQRAFVGSLSDLESAVAVVAVFEAVDCSIRRKQRSQSSGTPRWAPLNCGTRPR